MHERRERDRHEARLRGCPLEVVLVYEDSVPPMSFGLSTTDSWPSQRLLARRAQTALEGVLQRIDRDGLDVTANATPGRPGPVLVSAATGAQLLVLGSSHHTALGRVLVGSIVAHCRRHAPCPVVVVRAPQPPERHSYRWLDHWKRFEEGAD